MIRTMKITCPVCGGKGHINSLTNIPPVPYGKPYMLCIDCPYCDGRGKVRYSVDFDLDSQALHLLKNKRKA